MYPGAVAVTTVAERALPILLDQSIISGLTLSPGSGLVPGYVSLEAVVGTRLGAGFGSRVGAVISVTADREPIRGPGLLYHWR